MTKQEQNIIEKALQKLTVPEIRQEINRITNVFKPSWLKEASTEDSLKIIKLSFKELNKRGFKK